MAATKTSAVDLARTEIDRAVESVPESLRKGVTVRRAQHCATQAIAEYESALALIKFAAGEAHAQS